VDLVTVLADADLGLDFSDLDVLRFLWFRHAWKSSTIPRKLKEVLSNRQRRDPRVCGTCSLTTPRAWQGWSASGGCPGVKASPGKSFGSKGRRGSRGQRRMHSETAVCTQHPAKPTPEPSTPSDYSGSCRSGICLAFPWADQLRERAEGVRRVIPCVR